MDKKLYQVLASTINAKQNCVKAGHETWRNNHMAVIDSLVRNSLPSGAGIDSGCTINNESWKVLKIQSSYHAMNENGYYDGWIDFSVTVNPSLMNDIDLNITGRFGKYADVKEYLYDVFYDALMSDVSKETLDNLYTN